MAGTGGEMKEGAGEGAAWRRRETVWFMAPTETTKQGLRRAALNYVHVLLCLGRVRLGHLHSRQCAILAQWAPHTSCTRGTVACVAASGCPSIQPLSCFAVSRAHAPLWTPLLSVMQTSRAGFLQIRLSSSLCLDFVAWQRRVDASQGSHAPCVGADAPAHEGYVLSSCA